MHKIRIIRLPPRRTPLLCELSVVAMCRYGRHGPRPFVGASRFAVGVPNACSDMPQHPPHLPAQSVGASSIRRPAFGLAEVARSSISRKGLL